MGKSKKRNFNKNTKSKGSVLKRNDAVAAVISDIRKNVITDETRHFINLFGIRAEELTESGASIEELSLFKYLFYE